MYCLTLLLTCPYFWGLEIPARICDPLAFKRLPSDLDLFCVPDDEELVADLLKDWLAF